ncbi:MAG TPA: hypothetical protein VN670_06265 [Acidobacteriaceae bacterium]|nr:hypothetical protein [Acidobacteriaceae bacterium]
MNNNDLERALMEMEEIAPSSGFVASVMEAVQQEVSAPAPIPFPWKWALPGGIVSVVLTVGLIIRWFYGIPRAEQPSTDSAIAFIAFMGNLSAWIPHGQIAVSTFVAMEWSLLAVLISLLAVWIPMHYIAGRD